MATITRRGTPVHTAGDLPATGQPAPEARFTQNDLSELALSDLKGQRVILNIYPSIDTPTCAKSTRRFNEEAAALPGTRVLCVSADLPFAQARFCGAEGLERVITVSTFRNPEFGKTYGVEMLDGPLKGLLSRAIVVIDESGTVVHTEQVPEIAQEPDYQAALAAL
ncbi:MAG: thiol peroxidase [Marinobacter sp.]|uniref:thiol peroxidase n=1 Tax=Marinobacter sp. TaxID=50741 RepID=UPI00299F0BAE|nr:thiol peroxidase [Marinobacter sp.]MDX1634459.1 thiol peroxidase [Marinobacter sp.]